MKKSFRERWLIGFPLMTAAFAMSGVAAGPPLFLWQAVRMGAGIPQIVLQIVGGVWTVIVVVVGPVIFYKLVRTVFDLESDPS